MSGGGQGAEGKAADLQGLAVRDGFALEADSVRSVDEVLRTMGAGEDQAAGEVVVVDVRLSNVRDADSRGARSFLDPVRVPLRVDHQGHAAVMHQVAAVPELRGLDDNNVHASASFEGRDPGSGAETVQFCTTLPGFPGVQARVDAGGVSAGAWKWCRNADCGFRPSGERGGLRLRDGPRAHECAGRRPRKAPRTGSRPVLIRGLPRLT